MELDTTCGVHHIHMQLKQLFVRVIIQVSGEKGMERQDWEEDLVNFEGWVMSSRYHCQEHVTAGNYGINDRRWVQTLAWTGI